MRNLLVVVLTIAGLSSPVDAVAQASASGEPAGLGLAYQCAEIAGTSIFAPKWESSADGASGQVVRLWYRTGDAPSFVAWVRGGVEYDRSPGVGFPMGAGFAILVVAEDRLETYVYNAGTTELLFTQTRSGNSLLPNVVKAYRGTCVPGRQ
jgi:hypothetical protein